MLRVKCITGVNKSLIALLTKYIYHKDIVNTKFITKSRKFFGSYNVNMIYNTIKLYL